MFIWRTALTGTGRGPLGRYSKTGHPYSLPMIWGYRQRESPSGVNFRIFPASSTCPWQGWVLQRPKRFPMKISVLYLLFVHIFFTYLFTSKHTYLPTYLPAYMYTYMHTCLPKPHACAQIVRTYAYAAIPLELGPGG